MNAFLFVILLRFACPPCGGVGGRCIRQPGGGLHPNPAQRQLGFFQQQDDQHSQSNHTSLAHNEYHSEDFASGEQSQFILLSHSTTVLPILTASILHLQTLFPSLF